MAQLLETALLNTLNYQILIASKASRVHESARGQVVLEFGLRRAHATGANAGARAALIGGAQYTSNVGMSHLLGFSPKGTHAHSMVQAFMALGVGELEAFRAYADVYPDDTLLLVDTIDTLRSGVPNAIRVFEELRRKGHEPVGIRLDSGDLAYLSIQAACMLDKAGFPDATIVLSNQLDELTILQIIRQIEEEAPRYQVDADRLVRRLVFGVGTNLITSQGSPALGGVYKLVAIQDNGDWVPAIKISENPIKTPNPGHKRLWRIYDDRGQATADLMALDNEVPRDQDRLILRHPTDATRYRLLSQEAITEIEPLLVPAWRNGKQVQSQRSVAEMRDSRVADLERLDPGVRRIVNPHIYHVSLSDQLWTLKRDLIKGARDSVAGATG
jgi:nicotinate phosphoribosyltransferase